MTDRLAALAVLAHRFPETQAARQALADFFKRFEHDDLVLDKWFALKATVPAQGSVEAVAKLVEHEKFSMRNPNRVRAVIGTFAAGNPLAFHRADGAGYRWVAEKIIAPRQAQSTGCCASRNDLQVLEKLRAGTPSGSRVRVASGSGFRPLIHRR